MCNQCDSATLTSSVFFSSECVNALCVPILFRFHPYICSSKFCLHMIKSNNGTNPKFLLLCLFKTAYVSYMLLLFLCNLLTTKSVSKYVMPACLSVPARSYMSSDVGSFIAIIFQGIIVNIPGGQEVCNVEQLQQV